MRFAWFGLIVLASVAVPSVARALPAFARAYQVPCSTCHATIPVRNEFGEIFRRNGYRWPGELDVDARARKPEPLPMLGIGFMDATFPLVVPVAFIGTFGASYSNDDELEHPIGFGSPSLKVMLGTTLGEHAALFTEWTGSGAPNRLFVHLTRLANRRELNVIIGRFEPTTTLLRANDSYFDTFAVSGSPVDGHVLGQGRNGLEVNGVLWKRGFYAVGMVQNAGADSNFDAYYHASLKLGGANWLGEEPDIDLEETSWVDDISVELAQWGYYGLSGDFGVPGYELRRVGGDIRFGFRALRLRNGVMLGADVDRRVDLTNRSITNTTELSYGVTAWLTVAGQIDYQDAAAARSAFTQYQLGLLALAFENVRARLAMGYADDDDSLFGSLQLLVGI
ncbi:MAG: hypothetical protein ACAI38_25595 [Myxococcota bacterium]